MLVTFWVNRTSELLQNATLSKDVFSQHHCECQSLPQTALCVRYSLCSVSFLTLAVSEKRSFKPLSLSGLTEKSALRKKPLISQADKFKVIYWQSGRLSTVHSCIMINYLNINVSRSQWTSHMSKNGLLQIRGTFECGLLCMNTFLVKYKHFRHIVSILYYCTKEMFINP